MIETTRMEVLPLSGTIHDNDNDGGGGVNDDDPVGGGRGLVGGGRTVPPKHTHQPQTPQGIPNNDVPAYIISTPVLGDKGDEENNDNDDGDDDDDGYLSDCSSLGSKSVTTSARERQRRDIFKSLAVVAAGAGDNPNKCTTTTTSNNNNNKNTGAVAVAHHHIYDSLEEEVGEIERKQQKDEEVEGGRGTGGRKSLIVNNGMGRLRVSLPPTLRKQQQKSSRLLLLQKEPQQQQQQQQRRNDDDNIGGKSSHYFDGSEFFPPILLPPQSMSSSSTTTTTTFAARPSLSRPYDKDHDCDDCDNGGGDDDDDGKDIKIRRGFDPFGVDDDEGHSCYLRTTTSNLTNQSDTSNESFSFQRYAQYDFDSERQSLVLNNHHHRHHNQEVQENSDEIVVENEFDVTDNDSNNAVASLGSKDEGSKHRARRPVKFLSQVVARTLGGAKRRNQSQRKQQQELKPPIESSLLCYNSLSIAGKSYPSRRRNSTDRYGFLPSRQSDDRSSRSSRSTMSPPSPNSSAVGHNNVGLHHEGEDMPDVVPHKGGKDVGAEYGDWCNNTITVSDTSSPVLTSFKEATSQYSPTSVGKERHDQMFANGLRSKNNDVDKPDGDRWLYSSALTLSSWDDFEGAHTFRCDSPSFIFYPSTFKQYERKREE